jgi:hypothetical protein
MEEARRGERFSNRKTFKFDLHSLGSNAEAIILSDGPIADDKIITNEKEKNLNITAQLLFSNVADGLTMIRICPKRDTL